MRAPCSRVLHIEKTECMGQVDILLGKPLKLSRLARARAPCSRVLCAHKHDCMGQVDILLGTPLRLSRLARARRADLAGVRDVVCDEAGQLLGAALGYRSFRLLRF